MARNLFVLAWVALLSLPLSATAAPSIETYGKLPGITDVTLSPSGAFVAMIADVGAGRQLMVMTVEGKPIKIMKVGLVRIVGLRWAGNDHVLVELSKAVDVGPYWLKSKQDLLSVLSFNLSSGKGMAVFANRDSVNPVVFGQYGTAQIDGHWFGFFGGETLEVVQGDPGARRYTNTFIDGDVEYINTDLYRVDLDSGNLKLVTPGEHGARGWLVDARGEVIARSVRVEKTGQWRIMTGGSQGRELERGHSTSGGAEILGFGQTTDSLLISHPTDDGWVTDDVPLNGGAAKTVIDEKSDQSILYDDIGERWIGLAADGDEPAYHFFSPVFEARVRGARKAFPGYYTRLVSNSDDFSRMVVFTAGKDDPGTYWRVDIATHSADPIGYPYPRIAATDVGATRMVDFKAGDGLALRGVLTLPPGRVAKGLPLIVFPHGGPGARDYPGFGWWPQAYASRGYAVFQPNFRGSTGYGEAFRAAGDGQWGRKMQTDISDGVAELAHEGVVDPKRACIVGGSYGGYAALAGVTVQHGLYRCAVSFAGISDIGKMYGDDTRESADSPDLTHALKLQLGDRSGWRAVSPARLADKADAPILLIHGKDDTVVPISQSDAMEKALLAAGKPVERLTLPGGDHWLLGEDARVAMLKSSVAFVEKYNPPDARPPAH